MTNKFDYGDSARIIQSAPTRWRPGESVAICGYRIISSDTLAKEYLQAIGTIIYTVEYSDGKDAEIPEAYLSPL